MVVLHLAGDFRLTDPDDERPDVGYLLDRETPLEDALAAINAEYGGLAWGEDAVVVSAYGRDADLMRDAIQAVLTDWTMRSGSYAVL